MRIAALLGTLAIAVCLGGCGQGTQGEKGDTGPAGPPGLKGIPGLPGRRVQKALPGRRGLRGHPDLLAPLARRSGSCSRIAVLRVAPPNVVRTKCLSSLTAAPEEHQPCSRASEPPPVERGVQQAVHFLRSAQRCHRRTAENGDRVRGASCRTTRLVHAVAVRANMRSILVAMMKSFSCSPLIFLVCRETVALPQPKLIFG